MWLATFIYGYPQQHLHRQLWEDIVTLSGTCVIPWIIIGDLNELSTFADKLAKNIGNSTRLNKFNSFLNMNNLIDIGQIRLSFTWWNSKQKENAIYERPDRVVANPTWINIYKEVYVENLPIVGSDHGPILLSMTNQFLAKRYPPFRFDANGYYMRPFVKWFITLGENLLRVPRPFSWQGKSNFLQRKSKNGKGLSYQGKQRS